MYKAGWAACVCVVLVPKQLVPLTLSKARHQNSGAIGPQSCHLTKQSITESWNPLITALVTCGDLTVLIEERDGGSGEVSSEQ